jgi:hypothetical protein
MALKAIEKDAARSNPSNTNPTGWRGALLDPNLVRCRESKSTVIEWSAHEGIFKTAVAVINPWGGLRAAVHFPYYIDISAEWLSYSTASSRALLSTKHEDLAR